MSKADISSKILRIEDENIWQQMMEDSETKCVVVNAHPSWCGPCDAIVPTMSRVLLDYEKAEDRFLYCTGNIAKIGAQMQPTFPSDSTVNLEKAGCLPMFAIYRSKACVAVIVGVDSPTLLMHISTHMPALPQKD